MDNDDVQDLDGREILPYYAVVKEAVDQYADDLLPFYDGPEDIKIASNFGKRTDIWYCGWQCIRIRRECCRKRRKD